MCRVRPPGPIHLLVGRIDQLAGTNPPDPSDLDVDDSSNLWVSIAGQTGLIRTSQNKGSAPGRGPAAGAACEFATS